MGRLSALHHLIQVIGQSLWDNSIYWAWAPIEANNEHQFKNSAQNTPKIQLIKLKEIPEQCLRLAFNDHSFTRQMLFWISTISHSRIFKITASSFAAFMTFVDVNLPLKLITWRRFWRHISWILALYPMQFEMSLCGSHFSQTVNTFRLSFCSWLIILIVHEEHKLTVF